MSDDFVFDPSKLGERPPNPFDPLPNGKYVVVLDKAEKKALKNADNGSRLACEFTITRGEHEHRKLFKSYNLWHTAPPKEPGKPSAKMVAEWEFAELCKACGKDGPLRNFEDLYHIPVVATVKLRPASNGFEAQNEISKIEKEGAETVTTTTTDAPAKGTCAPWSGKK